MTWLNEFVQSLLAHLNSLPIIFTWLLVIDYNYWTHLAAFYKKKLLS